MHVRTLRLFSFLLGFAASIATACPARAGEVIPAPTQLPTTLSLNDALRMFHATGLDLLIADASTRSAEGAVKIAGAVPNPTFSASVGNAFTYSTGDPTQCMAGGSSVSCSPWIYQVGLTDSSAIVDSLSGKRTLRLKAARNALAAAKMSRADAERTLALQVKSAYAQVAQAELGYKFAREIASSNATTLKKTQERYKAGAIQEGELMRVETQKLESDQAQDTAANNLEDARYALAFLLGVRGRVSDFDVDTTVLDYATPAPLQSATAVSLLRAAFDHRPDLIALGYQRASAEAQIALAKRQNFPNIELGVTYAWGGYGGAGTNGPLQTPTITFGLTVPLPIFYQQGGEIRQAEAAYDTSALQQAKTTAQVVNDVSTAFANFTTAKHLVERMEGPRRAGGGLLQSAKGAFETTAVLYERGATTLTDYLDALRTYIATKVEYIGDLTNYWTAIYQLEAAVGMDLRK